MQPSAVPTVDPSTFGNYSDWAKDRMSKGASAQSLQAQLQAEGKTPTQTAAPDSGGSWWEKLLPTAGSIIGGMGGELLAPVVGGIGGAAAGGAAGKWLENTLTGQSGGKDVLTSAIEGGVGQGTGEAIGGIGNLLAGKVIAPLAEKGATQLVAGQAPKGAIAKPLADYLVKDLGMTNLEKAGDVAGVITGGANRAMDSEGMAEVTKFVENGLSNSPIKTLDLSNFAPINATPQKLAMARSAAPSNVLEQAIKENSLSGTPAAAAVRTKVGGVINSFDNPGSVDALDALGAQREVSNLASHEYNVFRQTQDPTALARYNTYQQVNNAMKSALQLDKMPVAPEDLGALGSALETHIAPIDKKAASAIGDQIRNLTGADGSAPTLADVRHFESPFAQIKGALQSQENAVNNNFGTSMGSMAKSSLPLAGSVVGIGGPKSLLGTVGGLATSSSAADKVGAGLLSKLSSVAGSSTAEKAIPLLAKIGAITASTAPNFASAGTTPINGTMPQIQGANGMNPTMGAGGLPNSSYNSIVNSVMQAAMIDPEHYAGMASAIIPGAMPQLQHAQMAGAAANTALGGFAGAGGAQGMGGGLLSKLTGFIPGTAANTYQNEQTAAAAQLAQALGISPQQAMAMLPQLMQAQPQAGQQIGGVRSILGSLPGAAQ